MVDGIYLMTYRGAADWGSGMLLLQNGMVTGADVAGIQYDGSYVETSDSIEVNLVLTVPPGASLVQGVPAQPFTYKIPIKSVLPKSAITKLEPILMELPPGPVNVIFKKLRDLS